jgi:LysM repeat protein/uncharacterized protein YvpB
MGKTKLSPIVILLIAFISSSILPVQVALAQGLPKEAYISGVIGHRQTYALSCESRSAADLAAFYDIPINEVEFFNRLPKSDNPNLGFVGSVHGTWGYIPPNPYGIHAKPVARLLRDYGLEARPKVGMSWKALRSEIAAGRPVIVWVIGQVWSGTKQFYTTKDGERVLVAAYEHTMILIGYDQNNVHLIDSGTGYRLTHPISNFRDSWDVLNNMAVVVTNPPENARDDSTGDHSGNNVGTYTVRSGDYLSKIAREYDVAWQDIAVLNNLSYPYLVYAGQKLKIPGAGVSTEQTKQEEKAEPPKNESDQAPETGASAESYKVQKGDYLTKIARELDLNWREIAELNGLGWPYTVYPGQFLKLPGSIALEKPAEVPKEKSPETEKNVPAKYVVQRGEYLVAIARKFSINWQTLATLNGINYPYVVYPGQVLKMR